MIRNNGARRSQASELAAKIAVQASSVIRWKRSVDGYVESHCGRWRIRPLFWGRVNPQSFELLREGIVMGTRNTQRAAKDLARDTGDGPGERHSKIRVPATEKDL